jgi:hypothetical protein
MVPVKWLEVREEFAKVVFKGHDCAACAIELRVQGP